MSVRRLSMIAIGVLFLPTPVLADDSSDLLALEARWNAAVVSRDVAVLGEIIRDDFVLIAANGTSLNKAQLIEAVAERHVTLDPFGTEEVAVRIYGDTAVVTGRFTQTGRLGDQSETASFRYTDVYVRGPEGWRAASAQATVIRQPHAPAR